MSRGLEKVFSTKTPSIRWKMRRRKLLESAQKIMPIIQFRERKREENRREGRRKERKEKEKEIEENRQFFG